MNFHQIIPAHPARSRRRSFLAIGLGSLLPLLLSPNAGAGGATAVLSFTNATPIIINDGDANGSPFPSTIQVPALPGALQSVTVTLYGLTTPNTGPIEILLAGPAASGQALELMRNEGSGAASGATITLADSAAPFSSGTITTGTYQPSGNASASYFSDFPQDVTTNQLAGFIGTTLEGTWSLYEFYGNYVNAAGDGSFSGGWSLTFTLMSAAPSVTTLAASALTPTNATLNASVDPNLGATTVYFQYGPTAAYGSFSATNILASDLVDAQAVALAITGLPPGTTNHFQAVAQNSAGTSLGGDLTFVTPAAQSSTPPALDASLTNGGNLLLTLYGTPGSNYVILYTSSLSPPVTWTVLTNLTLTNSVQFINPGLPANQAKFFALVTAAPAVTTLAASTVTPASATLNAAVNPNGGPATVYFEYGPTTAYGNFSATNTLASGLAGAQAVAQAVTGLPPGTTNHFQAVAQNSLGTNYGGDLTFITPPAPPVLGASLTNSANLVLTLHGNSGSTYAIMAAANLSAQANWAMFTNMTLTNAVQVIVLGPATNQMEFFRAVQQ
jgi:hypothetical protein